MKTYMYDLRFREYIFSVRYDMSHTKYLTIQTSRRLRDGTGDMFPFAK